TPPMAAPPTVPSTPPPVMTAPATPPMPAPVTAPFWRRLMLSHEAQPAMAMTSRPTALSFAICVGFTIDSCDIHRWPVIYPTESVFRYDVAIERKHSKNLFLKAAGCP